MIRFGTVPTNGRERVWQGVCSWMKANPGEGLAGEYIGIGAGLKGKLPGFRNEPSSSSDPASR